MDNIEIQKSTVALTLRITGIFWIVAKLISWKVWVKDRTFPLVPVADFLNYIPNTIHWVLLILSVLLLVLLIIKPLDKYILITFIAAEIIACMLDQNRWQPWEYQYLFTFFIVAINRHDFRISNYAFTFLLVTTYIYSGLHKFNAGFLYLIWDRMILAAFFKISASYIIHNKMIFYAGYLLGVLECVSGVGLLFRRTRKVAAIVLIAMHFFNLLLLGPLGLHFNKIVWPWNVVMIGYLYILFIRQMGNIVDFSLFPHLKKGWNKAVLLAWGILPAFSFIGWWDDYLSSNLYSGGLQSMAVCIADNTALAQLQPYFSKTDPLGICNGTSLLYIQRWAMNEMNVPPYPEKRVYKKIKAACIKDFNGINCNYYRFYYTYNGVFTKEVL